VLAAQVAAFMSTIDSQVNTGASYMVNDIYRRFIHPEGDRKHFVRASQVSSLIMFGLALALSFAMTSVHEAWKYQANLIAGFGFVVVARWFWWRLNAWSEMAALIGSALGTILTNHILDIPSFGWKFIITALISIAAFIVVGASTRPDPLSSLAEFCRTVKPYPWGWGPVREAYPDIEWSPNLSRNVLLWIVGTAAVFGICFGLGHLLLGTRVEGLILLGCSALIFVGLVRYWRP